MAASQASVQIWRRRVTAMGGYEITILCEPMAQDEEEVS